MKQPYLHPTAFALAITSGIVYAICAAFVGLWPTTAMRFFDDWFHGINLSAIAATPSITVGNFFRGLVEIMVFAYVVGVIFVWTYRACERHCKRLGWI
ncbi:hypothetical protein HY493_00515 [Candidatus Woesearchaeota archaeon]|nr:hypothetical protein [Candidatus Woesearchaeota archaeon]